MNVTNVKVEFMIFGEVILPDEISMRLNVIPTLQWRKGDPLRNGREQECSGWEISTDYEESLDINAQLSRIINKVKEKREELTNICNKSGMESRFCISRLKMDKHQSWLLIERLLNLFIL